MSCSKSFLFFFWSFFFLFPLQREIFENTEKIRWKWSCFEKMAFSFLLAFGNSFIYLFIHFVVRLLCGCSASYRPCHIRAKQYWLAKESACAWLEIELAFKKESLDVQVLENGRICTSFGHVEEPYIKSNTHHFACKLHLEGAEKIYIYIYIFKVQPGVPF
jgi:hypothetical protein